MAAAVTVRPWNRRKDRAAIERWPRPNLPTHWAHLLDNDIGRRQRFAVDLVDELVGSITLRDFDDDQATIGIFLRPDKYGQGIGTAGLTAFFNISPVRFLIADVSTDNARAVKCYEKSGFLHIQVLNGYYRMGKYIYAPNGSNIDRPTFGVPH